jgi:hypothetical protein
MLSADQVQHICWVCVGRVRYRIGDWTAVSLYNTHVLGIRADRSARLDSGIPKQKSNVA